MRVLIADGGTGGHIFPALAVAREFQTRKEFEALLVTGSAAGLESELVPAQGFPLRLLHVGGLIGKSLMTRIQTLLQLPYAYWESRRILKEFRPHIAIGFGAYASGPVLVAAHHKKIPILLVEPNAIPGFTNRMALKYAVRVAVPFEDTDGLFLGKAIVTGVPVRPLRNLPVERSKFTLGIFCGSQGSRAVNETVLEALPRLAVLRERLHIIHQSGKNHFDSISKKYREIAPFFEVVPFIHEVEYFYSRCDLLICRAGAVTLAEITSLGKPAILIPLPTAAHNHQEQNARRLADAGAARMVLQKDFTPDSLIRILQEFLTAPDRLKEMAIKSRAMGRPEATKHLVDLAIQLATGEYNVYE
jgi:UDP-N-acetylglucosamine--N-acetylmuramyl-(pentapeptide) pyrophosphoryl-undecaprenol N-acetylglucosamine transferase